jgi:2-keto-4-pentenoate hydratase
VLPTVAEATYSEHRGGTVASPWCCIRALRQCLIDMRGSGAMLGEMHDHADVDVLDVATTLWRAAQSACLTEAPSSRYPSFSLADGYAVGQDLHRRRLAAGAMQVGVKLGFTNRGLWRKLGLDGPFWSSMYDSTVITRPGQLSVADFVQPRIEPEIALGITADLTAESDIGEICAAIGWAALAFEIVQCHYPDWKMTPADAVADAGLHARLALGQPIELAAHDAIDLAAVEVELSIGDVTAERGVGANALGGPLDAITWLLGLPGFDGLSSGAIVTTGTLTTALPVRTDQRWRVDARGPVVLPGLEMSLR